MHYVHERTGMDHFCLAGGIALNCSLNRVLSKLPFIKGLFVQPAASDRGLALGCALQAAFEHGEPVFGLPHAFLGPRYEDGTIRQAIELAGLEYEEVENAPLHAAKLLAAGAIVGWWQGRSEFGPRALGNRSILADPRPFEMKERINSRIKFREEFRPFAPAALEESSSAMFDMSRPSPFMTVAYDVRDEWKSRLGAVTHINGTARVQTVGRETNEPFHTLIKEFSSLTSTPAVLNTSFNVRGQPIVETPLDALSTFNSCGMDAVFIGRYFLKKPRCPQM
jgi:carbamoyltransferase